MADFFETVAPLVGVTADNFKDLSGPQALQLYVDSLEKANLSQSQMTFFMEAIASDATALLPHPPAILKHLYSTQYLLTEWPCRYHERQQNSFANHL